MRLLKHIGKGKVKTFSTISLELKFSSCYFKVQFITNDNLKFPILSFFTQTLLSGKWPSVLKLFSDH